MHKIPNGLSSSIFSHRTTCLPGVIGDSSLFTPHKRSKTETWSGIYGYLQFMRYEEGLFMALCKVGFVIRQYDHKSKWTTNVIQWYFTSNFTKIWLPP